MINLDVALQLAVCAIIGAIWLEIRGIRKRLHSVEGAMNVVAGLLRAKGVDIIAPK